MHLVVKLYKVGVEPIHLWRCQPQIPFSILFLLGENIAFFVDDFILPGALPDYSVRNSN